MALTSTSKRRGSNDKLLDRAGKGSTGGKKGNPPMHKKVGLNKLSRHDDDSMGNNLLNNGSSLSSRNKNTSNPTSSRNSSSTSTAGQASSEMIASQNNQTTTTRRKPLDPTLLARGMTARAVGSRVSSHIKPLSAFEIEKDIRHMEAYGAACIAYSQQFFAFTNRELVSRGHYGPAAPAPGATYNDPSLFPTSTPGHGPQQSQNGYAGAGITMPIRIDPEEEKRVAILRNRVAASESKREVLETEYLSLRAHYVHESHKLLRTREAVTGQLQLLKDIVKRRGERLALRRARCAVAKDILHSLEYRSVALQCPVNNNNNNMSNVRFISPLSDDGEIASAAAAEDKPSNTTTTTSDGTMDSGTQPMEGVENTSSLKTKGDSNNGVSNADSVHGDMSDIWDLIETKLQEAEINGTKVETPKELLQVKESLAADAAALEAAKEKVSMSNGAMVQRRSKSPNQNDEDESSSSGKKKNGEKNKSKKETDDSAGDLESSGINKKRLNGDTDDNTVAWNCHVMPRTPYDVAILLSNLSTSADGAVAFVCGDGVNVPSDSLLWLESNLPDQSNKKMEKEMEKLKRLREEVKMLSEELSKETKLNSDLQRESIKGRKRRDQLCAMMAMIRSETEAVIDRFNIILETPEAQARAQSLQPCSDTSFDMHSSDAAIAGYLEEGELDDNTEEGTVVADEDEGEENVDNDQMGFGEVNVQNNDSAYDTYDEENGQPMKEVIVPRIESGEVDITINKRGYSVANDEGDIDQDKKRRKI